MIPRGLFTQIGMLLLAGGIFFTYLQPSFSAITATQDDIALIRMEQSKVTEVNTLLRTHQDKIDQISAVDVTRLTTYLPSRVDMVAVQRDLTFIAREAGVRLTSLSADVKSAQPSRAGAAVANTVAQMRQERSVQLGFIAEYQTVKRFLELLERNHYPLHVRAITIVSAVDTPSGAVAAVPVGVGSLAVDMTLVTYEFTGPQITQ